MSSPLTDPELSTLLKQQARELGFGLSGIAPAVRPDTLEHFTQWLRDGRYATMEYLPRREAAYAHPSGVMQSVRSILVVALNYGKGERSPDVPGRIAAYAQGKADYHDVLRGKLQRIADVLHEHRPGCRTRLAVDTAPLLERDLARRAGLGWFGKNTMLISKHQGSYFFLAAVLTDASLPADQPHETSHCGTCTRCLEACPTAAFPEPGVLDASRCISYLTIELRGQPVPVLLRNGMGDWLFGCDVCQQVCPWNRKAPAGADPDLMPDPEMTTVAAGEFLTMSDEQFQERFGSTPLSRPGRVGMARNAAIALGNRRDPDSIEALKVALSDVSPVVRGAAAWGLGELAGEGTRTILERQLLVESDPEVVHEIQSALQRLERTGRSPGIPQG